MIVRKLYFLLEIIAFTLHESATKLKGLSCKTVIFVHLNCLTLIYTIASLFLCFMRSQLALLKTCTKKVGLAIRKKCVSMLYKRPSTKTERRHFFV